MTRTVFDIQIKRLAAVGVRLFKKDDIDYLYNEMISFNDADFIKSCDNLIRLEEPPRNIVGWFYAQRKYESASDVVFTPVDSVTPLVVSLWTQTIKEVLRVWGGMSHEYKSYCRWLSNESEKYDNGLSFECFLEKNLEVLKKQSQLKNE